MARNGKWRSGRWPQRAVGSISQCTFPPYIPMYGEQQGLLQFSDGVPWTCLRLSMAALRIGPPGRIKPRG